MSNNNLGANLTSITESTGNLDNDLQLSTQSAALHQRAEILKQSENTYDRALGELLQKGVDIALKRANALNTIERIDKDEIKDELQLLRAQNQLEELDLENLDIITNTILNRLNKLGLNIDITTLRSYINIEASLGYFYYIENLTNPPKELDRIKGMRALENSIQINFITTDSAIQDKIVKSLSECGFEFQQISILIKGRKTESSELTDSFQEGTFKNFGVDGFELPITYTFEYTLDLFKDFIDINDLQERGINIEDLTRYITSTEFKLNLGKALTGNRFMGATFYREYLNLIYIPQYDSRSIDEWHEDFNALINSIELIYKNALQDRFGINDITINKITLKKLFLKLLVVSSSPKEEGFVHYEEIMSNNSGWEHTRLMIVDELFK